MSTESNFPVWKSISVGGLTESQLKAQVRSSGSEITKFAQELIMSTSNFVYSKECRSVDLACVTLADLGFRKQPSSADIWDYIQKHARVCEREEALYLRLAYTDQPSSELLPVVMWMLRSTYSRFGILSVNAARDGMRYLGAEYAAPTRRWRLNQKIVFGLAPCSQ